MSQRARMLLQLVVLSAIAAGVGLYAYFGVFEADKKEAEKKEFTDRLFSPQQYGEKEPDGGSPEAEFTKLVITNKGETTVLEREPGGVWMITSPLKTKADKLTADGIVGQLQQQRVKNKLEENPDAETLKRYGLEPPEFTVESTALVGKAKTVRTSKLFGGVENTFDGSIYLRRSDDPAVYQAEGGVRFSLQKTTFDLRDKDVLAVDGAKVTKIDLKSKDNAWTLERQADKTWRLTKPTDTLADATTVSAMLGGLTAEHAQSFPTDTPENRKRFGLETPAVDATITTEDGANVRLRITRAAPDAGTTNTYAIRDDALGSTLAEMMMTAPGQLDRNVYDLRDKTVVLAKREDIRKITFHSPDAGTVTVEQESVDAGSGQWKLTAPKPGPAKSFKVSSVLWAVTSLKYAVAGEEKPKDWAKFGITDGARSITFYGADGAELGRFTVGKDVPGKPAMVYVRGTRNQVLEIDGSRFGELFPTADDLLDVPVPAPDAGAPSGAPH